jgi:hypothetical protein
MKLSCLISNDSGLLEYDAMSLHEWLLIVPYCARLKGYDHQRTSSMEPWKQGLGSAQVAWSCIIIAGMAQWLCLVPYS